MLPQSGHITGPGGEIQPAPFQDHFALHHQQLRLGGLPIPHQLDIGQSAGGNGAGVILAQPVGGVDGSKADGLHRLQPQCNGPGHHMVQLPLTHQLIQGHIVRHQADPVGNGQFIHGLYHSGAEVTFLNLDAEAQGQPLPQLFRIGRRMVAVDAGGSKALQPLPGQYRRVAVDHHAPFFGLADNGENMLLSIGHAVEVHHFAQTEDTRMLQHLRRFLRPHGAAAALKARGRGHRGRGQHQHLQRCAGGSLHQGVDPFGPQHVADLVGICRHHGGAAFQGTAGKGLGRQHTALQMHMGINKTRQRIQTFPVYRISCLA